MIDKQSVIESLRTVLDPEIGISIVDLKMVRDINITGDDVRVKIALTVAHCPLAKTLQSDVENALKKTGQVRTVTVETTAMTKTELNELRTQLQNKTTNTTSEPKTSIGPGIERLGKRDIRNIIAIVSGKGGVGKSFVTSMLACELRRLGYEVGVLDADLTGPSIAKIFGLTSHPTKTPAGAISPVQTSTGIKVMSINLVLDDPGTPVIWRGPIVNSVIRQLYWEVDWGPLHYLLVDLPPGCIASDSLIYANPHPVSAGQVKPGDYVYSLSGAVSSMGKRPNVLDATLQTRRVLEVVPQGETEIFELRTKTRKIRATFNHPILTLTKTRHDGQRNYDYSLDWKRLAELKRGDILPVIKKVPRKGAAPLTLPAITEKGRNNVALPTHSTDDFCRIVGYYVGDGFLRISSKTRAYQLLFAEPRLGRYRRKYVGLLESVFSGARIYQNQDQFGILSKRVTLLFQRLGLHRAALQRQVPQWVFELPESQIRAFIEGYCDADGFRRKERAGFRRPGWMVFESPNRLLLEQIRALAISIGLRVTNLNSRVRNLKPPSGREYSKTFWSFEATSTSRSDKYGAGLIRGRGRQSVEDGLTNEYIGFDRVTEIVRAGLGQVYDLKVEGDENFVADGLVVHNTSDAPLTVFQSLPLDGVIVVSSPQDLAALIVTKAVNMAKKMNAELLGLVENMSYLECPHCGEKINVYGQSNGEKLANQLGIHFLGSIPIDPMIARSSDQGRIEDYSSPAFHAITDRLRLRTSEQVKQLTQGLPIAWSIEPAKT